MKRFCITTIAALALCACAHVPLDPNATPAQVAAAKAQEKQANFDTACKYIGKGWAFLKPYTATPAVKDKIAALGSWAPVAVDSVDAFVTNSCGKPLNINDADALIDRAWDLGGQIAAIIVQAKLGT